MEERSYDDDRLWQRYYSRQQQRSRADRLPALVLLVLLAILITVAVRIWGGRA